jgi:hypothetical protein
LRSARDGIRLDEHGLGPHEQIHLRPLRGGRAADAGEKGRRPSAVSISATFAAAGDPAGPALLSPTNRATKRRRRPVVQVLGGVDLFETAVLFITAT